MKEGYNPKFGARPIRRTIEGKIEDHLSEAILKGEFNLGTTLAIDVESIPAATPLNKAETHLVFRRVEVPDETVTKMV